jgi:hypothetical protein
MNETPKTIHEMTVCCKDDKDKVIILLDIDHVYETKRNTMWKSDEKVTKFMNQLLFAWSVSVINQVKHPLA